MLKNRNVVYCFSPPVMIATFVIETALAVYTLLRYKTWTVVRLATAMLMLLAIFQLAEFNVCGSGGLLAMDWSRVGYVAITLLPPLAIHLIHVIAKRKERLLVWLAYASGLAFALAFGFRSSAFVGHVCAGNYAIFQLTPTLGGLYFVYYYAWLFIGIATCLYLIIKANRRIRTALSLQIFGYLSFLLPTGVVNAVNPQTIAGIPSIMCGIAVIYAFILAIGIVPIVLGS